MKRQPLATAIPEFVILFRVDVRIPMPAAQDSTGVAKPFEELITISISGMCQQFQVANQHPAINGIVWHKLDVISDQRMRLRNLMAVVPEDLELLINEGRASHLCWLCEGCREKLDGWRRRFVRHPQPH